MAVYCYYVRTVSGTLVGVLETVIYCIMINGMRGLPGWALGNLIIGISLGIAFKAIKRLGKPKLECVLYSKPMLVRMTNNIYGLITDAFILIISLPLYRFLEPQIKKYV